MIDPDDLKRPDMRYEDMDGCLSFCMLLFMALATIFCVGMHFLSK